MKILLHSIQLCLHPMHWMCQVFETVKEWITHTQTWVHTHIHTNMFKQSRGHKSCPMSVTENLNSQAHCTHVPSVVLCNFPFITPFSRNKNREADRAAGKWDQLTDTQPQFGLQRGSLARERDPTQSWKQRSPKAGHPLMSEEIAVLKTYGISGGVQPKGPQVLLSIFRASVLSWEFAFLMQRWLRCSTDTLAVTSSTKFSTCPDHQQPQTSVLGAGVGLMPRTSQDWEGCQDSSCLAPGLTRQVGLTSGWEKERLGENGGGLPGWGPGGWEGRKKKCAFHGSLEARVPPIAEWTWISLNLRFFSTEHENIIIHTVYFTGFW